MVLARRERLGGHRRRFGRFSLDFQNLFPLKGRKALTPLPFSMSNGRFYDFSCFLFPFLPKARTQKRRKREQKWRFCPKAPDLPFRSREFLWNLSCEGEQKSWNCEKTPDRDKEACWSLPKHPIHPAASCPFYSIPKRFPAMSDPLNVLWWGSAWPRYTTEKAFRILSDTAGWTGSCKTKHAMLKYTMLSQ